MKLKKYPTYSHLSLSLCVFLVKYTQGYFLGLPRVAKNLKKMCLPSDFKTSRSQFKISRDT